MSLKAVSPAVAALAIIVVVGVGASAYYFGMTAPSGASTPVAQASSSSTSSTSSAEAMPSTTSTTSTTSSTVSTPTIATTTTTSSSTMSSLSTTQSSSTGGGAQLKITFSAVAANLAGQPVTASCGSAMPASGYSYIAVSNTGTTPTVITNISFSYLDMAYESGAPKGTCTVAAGSTTYITLMGIGIDMATMGQMYSVSLTGTNGGFAYATGNLE